MELIIERQNEVVTVFLKGRLDTLAAQEVSDQMESLTEATSGTVVLDCTEMTYISSSGLRLFLTLRKAAAEKGGKVIVRGINNDIRSVFMMTGFLNLFEIES
ncbi:MAG: STAS domain-containing protein [Bacteroidales bacterium]|nr:STAS domain-containing protein [Bacteroidales bacterium]